MNKKSCSVVLAVVMLFTAVGFSSCGKTDNSVLPEFSEDYKYIYCDIVNNIYMQFEACVWDSINDRDDWIASKIDKEEAKNKVLKYDEKYFESNEIVIIRFVESTNDENVTVVGAKHKGSTILVNIELKNKYVTYEKTDKQGSHSVEELIVPIEKTKDSEKATKVGMLVINKAYDKVLYRSSHYDCRNKDFSTEYGVFKISSDDYEYERIFDGYTVVNSRSEIDEYHSTLVQKEWQENILANYDDEFFKSKSLIVYNFLTHRCERNVKLLGSNFADGKLYFNIELISPVCAHPWLTDMAIIEPTKNPFVFELPKSVSVPELYVLVINQAYNGVFCSAYYDCSK